jgi:hypothetical protein
MEETRKKRIYCTLLFVLALGITAYQQNAYEKFNASWDGINIYVWAFTLGPIIALVMNFINYVIAQKLGNGAKTYNRFTPNPVLYAVLTATCLLTTCLGIMFTEPDRAWSSSNTQVQHNDRFQQSSYYQWNSLSPEYDLGGLVDVLSSDSGSSDDSEGAAIAFMVRAILLILLALLVLSATIQHFWVVASITILFMMAQFLYRRWKYD